MELYLPRDHVRGCSDGNCILCDNKGEMHTNGGCQCERTIQRLGWVGLDAVRTIRFLRQQLQKAQQYQEDP